VVPNMRVKTICAALTLIGSPGVFIYRTGYTVPCGPRTCTITGDRIQLYLQQLYNV
jgi:hypothetical protein